MNYGAFIEPKIRVSAIFTIKMRHSSQGFSNPLCAIRFIMSSERWVVILWRGTCECKMEKNTEES